MGRHDRVHGRDHKAAVVHAYDVQAMTAEQVAHLAAAGKLKAPGKRDRLRPFKIAESTVKEYARLARRRAREAAGNGGHDPDDGPVPNDAVTVPAKPSVTPEELLPVTMRRENPKPAPERYPWNGEDLETSEIIRRLLAAENEPGDTSPPPQPD